LPGGFVIDSGLADGGFTTAWVAGTSAFGLLTGAAWRAALRQPAIDDRGCLGGVRGLVPATVLDEEGRFSRWAGVDLNAVKPVLVTDEIDIVVIGGAGDLEALDCQAWDTFA
jgi:hypothetical protein